MSTVTPPPLVPGVVPPGPTIPPAGTTVDLNTRYTAACMEINTRIGQRQNTLVIFISLVFGISAALTAKKDGFDTSSLVFVIPVASFVFAMLYLMHDLMISNLVDFCRRCESLNNVTSLPGYYLDPCQKRAVWIRKAHDIVAAILIVAANCIGFYLAYIFQTDFIKPNSLVAALWVGAVLLSIGMVLWPLATRR